MQLNVKLLQTMSLQSGMGKNGEWKKQDFIFETLDAKYPKKICATFWAENIPEKLILGNTFTLDFDIESREYNGKWYTDVRAWRITPLDRSETKQQDKEPEKNNNDSKHFFEDENEDDVLPF